MGMRVPWLVGGGTFSRDQTAIWGHPPWTDPRGDGQYVMAMHSVSGPELNAVSHFRATTVTLRHTLDRVLVVAVMAASNDWISITGGCL